MGIGLQIAGGFGRRLSGYMQEKEKYDWENKRAERKFGMTTGMMGVAKAEEKANATVSKVNYLITDRGIDKDILRFAFDQEKVAGINKIYDEVKLGSDQASGQQLNKLFYLAKDYAAVDDRPWSEVVREAYQIYATPENAAKHTQEQKDKKGFWASMLADPSSTSGYDDGQRYSGYTRADQDRIIMSSATTPRGEGTVKIDRSKRIEKLDPVDYYRFETGTKKLINDQMVLAKSRASRSPETIGDGTVNGSTLQQNLSRMQEADDWVGITSLYGDNILQSLYSAEQQFPGAILNNPAITPGQKTWLKNKFAKEEEDAKRIANLDFNEIYNSSISSLVENSKYTEPEIKLMPRFSTEEEFFNAIKKKEISKGQPFLIYDSTLNAYKIDEGGKAELSDNQTVKKTTTALNPDDFENVEAMPTGKSNILKRLEWDKKYKGIYTPEGTLIVVPPRPPEGETSRPGGKGSVKINPYKQWNDKYEKTHDPKTGIPFIAIPKNLDDLNKG